MAEPAILGPFREGNLCDELRFDPVDASLRDIVVGKWRDIRFDTSKSLRKNFQHRAIESGSNLSRIMKSLVSVHS